MRKPGVRSQQGPPFYIAFIWLVYMIYPIITLFDRPVNEMITGFLLVIIFSLIYIFSFFNFRWRFFSILLQNVFVGYFIFRYDVNFLYMAFYPSRTGYFQRAMRAGVKGFLLKDSPIAELALALRNVYAGGSAISPELALTFWEAENPLTEREREVLKQAQEGLSARDIGEKLFLSTGTVRNYLSEAIQKLDAKNRIDAMSIAEKNGWLD